MNICQHDMQTVKTQLLTCVKTVLLIGRAIITFSGFYIVLIIIFLPKTTSISLLNLNLKLCISLIKIKLVIWASTTVVSKKFQKIWKRFIQFINHSRIVSEFKIDYTWEEDIDLKTLKIFNILQPRY